MERKPNISVIIPMYNSELSIEKAIQSIFIQDPHGLQIEIIIVDDGSQDNSTSIVRQMNKGNLRVLQLEKNGGQANARNEGLRLAQGEWIQFMDSDDRVSSNLYSQFEKNLQPDKNCYLFSFIREMPTYSLRQTIKVIKDKRAFGHFGGTACNKFIKREICVEYKPLSCFEDICFVIDMMNQKELHMELIPGAYYCYNKKSDQSVTTRSSKPGFKKAYAYIYSQINSSDQWTRMYILEMSLAFLFDRNIPLSNSIPAALKTTIRLLSYLPAMMLNQNRKLIESKKI